MARIGSFGSYQAHQPGGAVPGKPALSGSEGDTGIPCSLRQRDILVEVGSEHREARHGLLALFLGACGQRRCTGWLLIHNAQGPPHLSRGVRKGIVQRTQLCSGAHADKTW